MLKLFNYTNKVIIVGNSGSMLSQKKGKQIDSFGTIVRCNEFLLEGYEEYCGARTDVLATASNRLLGKIIRKEGTTKNEHYINNVTSVWFTRNKFWVERTAKLIDIKKLIKAHNLKISTMLYSDFLFKKFSGQYWEKYKIKEGVDYWPSTGLIAIRMALSLCQKPIYITGFDSFSSGHYFKDNLNVGRKHIVEIEAKILNKWLNDNEIKKI
jgi:hypothetical protein